MFLNFENCKLVIAADNRTKWHIINSLQNNIAYDTAHESLAITAYASSDSETSLRLRAVSLENSLLVQS